MDGPNGGNRLWLRACSLLYRCALERCINDLWRATGSRAHRANARAKLACLTHVLEDDLALDIRHAWNELSALGHHRSGATPDPLVVRRMGRVARRAHAAVQAFERPQIAQRQTGHRESRQR